ATLPRDEPGGGVAEVGVAPFLGERPQGRRQAHQRSERNRRGEALLPPRLPHAALPGPGGCVLRVADGGEAKASLPVARGGRQPVRLRGVVGGVGGGRWRGDRILCPADDGGERVGAAGPRSDAGDLASGGLRPVAGPGTARSRAAPGLTAALSGGED